MMFPVNRPASELTATELMNLYDDAVVTGSDGCHCTSSEMDTARTTAKELRAEIERRMKPCTRSHADWSYQNQLAQQQLGYPGLGQGNR